MPDTPASRFFGDLDGFLAYADSQDKEFNPAFCSRHWAPCPVEGRNGVLASVLVMEYITTQIPDEIVKRGAAAMNLWMGSQTEPACCRMGEEAIAEIWEQC